MSRARERWQQFRREHQQVFQWLREEHPGFWQGMADIWDAYQEETHTTRGAVVREISSTREQGTQTTGGPGQAATTSSDAGVQTEAILEVEERAMGGDVAEKQELEEGGEDPRDSDGESGGGFIGTPKARGMEQRMLRTRRAPGCWNCWSRRHRYADCPHDRTNDFCFRCGELGVTLCDCPRCREAWRAQGPYAPGRGHVPRGD